MKIPLLSFVLVLALMGLVGYYWGRADWRRQRQANLGHRLRTELNRPLPWYMHRIDFEPLEYRPTVRVIRGAEAPGSTPGGVGAAPKVSGTDTGAGFPQAQDQEEVA